MNSSLEESTNILESIIYKISLEIKPISSDRLYQKTKKAFETGSLTEQSLKPPKKIMSSSKKAVVTSKINGSKAESASTYSSKYAKQDSSLKSPSKQLLSTPKDTQKRSNPHLSPSLSEQKQQVDQLSDRKEQKQQGSLQKQVNTRKQTNIKTIISQESTKAQPQPIQAMQSKNIISTSKKNSQTKQTLIDQENELAYAQLQNEKLQIKQRQSKMSDPERLNEEKALLKQMIMELEEKKLLKQQQLEVIKVKTTKEEQEVKQLRSNCLLEREKQRVSIQTLKQENSILEQQLNRIRDVYSKSSKEMRQCEQLEQEYKIEIAELKENIRLLEISNEKELQLLGLKIKTEKDKNQILKSQLEDLNFDIEFEQKIQGEERDQKAQAEQIEGRISSNKLKTQQLTKDLLKYQQEKEKQQMKFKGELAEEEKELLKFEKTNEEEQRKQESLIQNIIAEIETLKKEIMEEDNKLLQNADDSSEQLRQVILQQKEVVKQYENFKKQIDSDDGLASQIKTLKDKYHSEEQTEKELEEELEQLTKQESDIKERRENELLKLSNENAEIKSEIAQIEIQISSIRLKREESAKQIEEKKQQMGEELTQKQKEIEQLESLVASLSTAKTEQDAEISRIMQQIEGKKQEAEKTKEIEDLKHEIHAQKDRLSKNQNLFAKLEEELKQLESQIKTNSEDISSFQSFANKNVAQIQEKTEKNKQIQAEINALQTELNKKKKKK